MSKQNVTAARSATADSAERSEPETISVSEAGERLGLSKNSAYQAAHRGEIPVIRFGKLLRVPRARFERMLKGDGA